MAVSKSKETKKEPAKTNRRKPVTKATGPAVEGHTPGDLIDQLSKPSKNRMSMFDMMRAQSHHVCDGFMKHFDENVRLPVPINERRRVKIEKDEEYVSAQYAKMEQSEYIMIQAPTKTNYRLLWKIIQQDQVKIMVCLCHDDQMSASDDASKCFQYFPTEPNQSMEVEQKKGKLTILCKTREGLSMGAVKYEFELTDSEAVEEKNTDDPNATGSKALQITMFHMNTWTGTRPETGNALEQAQNVALFMREVNKAEISVLRKSIENFVPPVAIQSFDAIGRAGIAWAILMLLKDVEKRECFDMPDLIKKLMKLRPGCISSYFHFAFCMAVSLHIGKEMKWCENDCTNALKDLEAKFGDRKLNEVGNLAVN